MASRSPTTPKPHQKASAPPGVDGGLNAGDIQKILDEVSSTRYALPPDLDQLELLCDLNEAWKFYHIRKQAISKPYNTAIRTYAGKVAKAANDLYKILDQKNEGADYFRGAFPVNELQVILQHLQRTTIAPSLKLKPQSPSELFFGWQLPLVFEKHFKWKAKYSRPSSGGAPGGPFIRFAAAVASALDIKVGTETVAKAISAVRKDNSRRR
jgi:hypothetical protein